MKIPKYIETALKRRKLAAYTFTHNDSIISNFIKKNNIDCEYTGLHREALCNPDIATHHTIEAIIQKGRERE